ncbi:RNA polymerase sigma factor [Streptomyces sp. YIM 98790]|uniref:RNA polymerase sigma factor n=1 Tax=Streptomyces sp. YIM 98790 TaxID=2689077 RepID=UPI00140A0328|nr:RNA polymerase sigma factor [Streptomyces sp. YIM 98790]
MTDTGAGPARIEDLLRGNAPQVLGALVRRYGHFDTAEDAVQEALLAAAVQWPRDGTPDNPLGWLIRVASRKLTDLLRIEEARRRREDTELALLPRYRFLAPAPDDTDLPPSADDTLVLLFLCCHPELTPSSRIALTLRAVGGLTTAEIAHAFLVPEATMGQRISRAKQRIKRSGAAFAMPGPEERDRRLPDVLHILYLIFNEGYAATSGPDLQRTDLVAEAIRLTRILHRLLPGDREVAGLLALMLLTDARRPARTLPDGSLVPLAEQDRGLWNRAAIEEGVALITATLRHRRPGPYQVQAAIAAVHDEAERAEDTDWRQILALYELLEQLSPSPVVTLNRAVALAMVAGPRAGLELLERVAGDERLTGQHRLDAVRAHLLERAGELPSAREAYRRAAAATHSLPERRYLHERAARLAPGDGPRAPGG